VRQLSATLRGVRPFALFLPLFALPVVSGGCDVGLDGKRFDGGSGGATSSSTSGTGATGGQGGGGSGAGGGGSGGGVSCTLSDELDDARTLTACWTNAADAEGGANGFAQLGIDGTGYLVTRPEQGAGFWLNQRGPYLYKEVTGDFAMVSYITAHHQADENLAPTVDYNVGGIVVRSPPTGTETWLKYEIGHVDDGVGVGTLAGSTVGSVSEHLMPYHYEGLFRGRLALCRVGASVLYFFRPNPEGPWSAEDLQYTAGAGTAAADFPASVQAGITVSGYAPETPDVEAAFDYVRFAVQPMSGPDACVSALNTLSP